MQKKTYIQPETEILRDIYGEVVMAPLGPGIAGSPDHGEAAPAVRVHNNAPITF